MFNESSGPLFLKWFEPKWQSFLKQSTFRVNDHSSFRFTFSTLLSYTTIVVQMFCFSAVRIFETLPGSYNRKPHDSFNFWRGLILCFKRPGNWKRWKVELISFVSNFSVTLTRQSQRHYFLQYSHVQSFRDFFVKYSTWDCLIMVLEYSSVSVTPDNRKKIKRTLLDIQYTMLLFSVSIVIFSQLCMRDQWHSRDKEKNIVKSKIRLTLNIIWHQWHLRARKEVC